MLLVLKNKILKFNNLESIILQFCFHFYTFPNMESIADDRENLKDFLEEAELDQYYEFFRDILKVTKVSQLKFVATEDLVQIGLSKPEQRRYKKNYSKYFPHPYISKIKKLLSSNKKNESFPSGNSALPMEFQLFPENNVKVPTKHIISVEDITINKELGMGQFGVVQQGTWTTGNQRLQVAIKCLGNERMTSNSTEFLKEAAVMHSIEHPNIVRLYGVVLHLDSLMLVTELAPLRSLLECLREVSLRPNFPVPNLCEFAEQICDGMTYLENKRLIHRDLAARNILVFSKDRVKISDFGLSRALGVGKDYYQTNYNVNLKLPVAWCAPECILYLRFTSASDVWAFGVCLWEMFTYGFQPWAAFSGQQILEAIDAPNYQRLERPECCPEAYYSTMIECWSHNPNERPKFKDLATKLREIHPEQVQTTTIFRRTEEGRRSNLLEYKSGQIITVLGKEDMTKTSMWYGVLPGGACGIFDPSCTKSYVKPDKILMHASSPLSTRSSTRSSLRRSPLLRFDVKRHTITGKRVIQRNMISGPQGDLKHTSHVGLDGAYFGDISFLDPTSCPPRQIVTPYKPSEDLEQVPLINPNSPSHLTSASCTPYPLLNPAPNRNQNADRDEVDLSYTDSKTRNFKKQAHRSMPEPSTSKSILNLKVWSDFKNNTKRKAARIHKAAIGTGGGPALSAKLTDLEQRVINIIGTQAATGLVAVAEAGLSQVKIATLGRSHKNEDGIHATTSKTDEVHEYHEISDTDTESNATDNVRPENMVLPESPGVIKTYADFSQSLLDEMESMFRSLDGRGRRDEFGVSSKHFDIDSAIRSQTLNKMEKKKSFNTGTMKLMSAHDERTLETAVAMANEITTKSMNDLGCDHKLPNSPSERSKFHFKFPLVSLHHNPPHEPDKDVAGKQERRNFSEEANSVPDIQSTLTEESKLAYASLIEQPTPSSSLISQINTVATGIQKSSTMPKPTMSMTISKTQFHSLQIQPPRNRPSSAGEDSQNTNSEDARNELPLPPRTTKPKLVDKPRHIRKYPLKMLNDNINTQKPLDIQRDTSSRPIIYQNAVHCLMQRSDKKEQDKMQSQGIDVFDGPELKVDTNPFTNSTQTSVNPFIYEDELEGDSQATEDRGQYLDERSLVKDCTDHVSVEDLLEFADHRPCGRQRGVESDEVRIMSKVLKQQVTPSECLEALELCDWNVHHAIKLVRVKVAANLDVTLLDCCTELAKANGDIVKASAVLVLRKKNLK